ncbi:DUF2264 domain-containing protein [Enterobacteriaceae bacterium BIT-l23]|uniref:DUF2264 domain-containing protein n=1 Tax=Jejubacter sp. L23 TaxID=3092086 RepID=UPI0015854AB7|nr:DUF2264 domain-containing protein [Enterobacteriaceae bacterium BIT-l23]
MEPMKPGCRQTVKLETKQDVQQWFETLFSAVWRYRDSHSAGISLGNIIPVYGRRTAAMESFCRLLWGVFPVIAGKNDHSMNTSEVFRLIAQGTDPGHEHYWGDLVDFDQRCVEMAVLGVGLALAGASFNQYLSAQETENLVAWLHQLRRVELPCNNWSFFPIMVEMGLCLSGHSWSRHIIDKYFARIDDYYLGEGWYSDGRQRPRDYYNAMAFHYYGLLYSKLMADQDPTRCQMLRERASIFAHDFLHMFAENGAAIPFGRSLTYRFAQVAFWSAAAFAGINGVPAGVIKGLVLRNFRWWVQQEMTDPRGTLTVGYSYANAAIAEDYNAPGSPYWCCKAFLILILDEAHPFWETPEQTLPVVSQVARLAHTRQLVHHDRNNRHHYLLNAGQVAAKNYNNMESKYGKFAYSSLFGFNLEKSRFGIELNACDSTLLLSEQDEYYRGRRASCESVTTQDYIFTRWSPWSDVDIKSWLMPLTLGHLSIHFITTQRALDSVEGGFPVPLSDAGLPDKMGPLVNREFDLFSHIIDISPGCTRDRDVVISPPASNIIYPGSSGVPVLRKALNPGIHILVAWVQAGQGNVHNIDELPEVRINQKKLLVFTDNAVHELNISDK